MHESSSYDNDFSLENSNKNNFNMQFNSKKGNDSSNHEFENFTGTTDFPNKHNNQKVIDNYSQIYKIFNSIRSNNSKDKSSRNKSNNNNLSSNNTTNNVNAKNSSSNQDNVNVFQHLAKKEYNKYSDNQENQLNSSKTIVSYNSKVANETKRSKLDVKSLHKNNVEIEDFNNIHENKTKNSQIEHKLGINIAKIKEMYNQKKSLKNQFKQTYVQKKDDSTTSNSNIMSKEKLKTNNYSNQIINTKKEKTLENNRSSSKINPSNTINNKIDLKNTFVKEERPKSFNYNLPNSNNTNNKNEKVNESIEFGKNPFKKNLPPKFTEKALKIEERNLNKLNFQQKKALEAISNKKVVSFDSVRSNELEEELHDTVMKNLNAESIQEFSNFKDLLK
jgi:hypothetical protein